MENSRISWCTHTFNAWIGCSEVSPGCVNCYARELDKRYKYTEQGWGKDSPRYKTSGENQSMADKRIPELVEIPADVRFLSCEPLIQRVSLSSLESIHWVIIGGESGANARQFDTNWAISIVEDCRSAGVRVFVKQMGSNPSGCGALSDRAGTNIDDFPKHLQVREFPK